MESDAPAMDIALVTRTLKARMAKAACLHLDKVEPRAAVALQMAGVFKTDLGMGPIDNDARQILLNRDDSRRVQCCRGPFIFYRAAEEKGQQFALDVTMTLLADDAKLRIAALDHFDGLRTAKPACLSARTSRLLDDRRDLIMSSLREWRLGAVELFDAIQDDLLVHLAAVEQSLEQRFDEGIRDHLPKVLRPSITSIEGLELRIANPLAQRDEVIRFISECSSLPDLGAACASYMAVLGPVPLQADYSLGAVISKWLETHQTGVPWETLWNWADDERTPIARYHLCSAFLEHSEWIPKGMEPFVWREVTEVVAATSSITDALRWQTEWILLRQLAQHYLRFLGSWAPGALGDPLAVSAWWLANRVCQVLNRRSATKGPFVDTAISPELYGSSHAWRLSLPRATGSPLALATHLGGAPWVLSILQRIRRDSLDRFGAAVDGQLKSIFEQGLASTIMLGFPIANDSIVNTPMYQFELSLGEAIKAWGDFQTTERDAEVAASILVTYEKLIDVTRFVSTLRGISGEDELNQLIIANWARSLASQGLMPVDDVWPLLEDHDWMQTTFRKTRDTALDGLFLAFSLAFQNDRSKSAKLPHIYAMVCDALSDDPERMRIMFWYVAVSGLHSYSVSALQRLLTGEHRTKYLELCPDLKNWLTEGRSNPPWLAARIRGVLTALSMA